MCTGEGKREIKTERISPKQRERKRKRENKKRMHWIKKERKKERKKCNILRKSEMTILIYCQYNFFPVATEPSVVINNWVNFKRSHPMHIGWFSGRGRNDNNIFGLVLHWIYRVLHNLRVGLGRIRRKRRKVTRDDAEKGKRIKEGRRRRVREGKKAEWLR